MNERYVVLHNVRSAHNVGSVFRTADGAGVHEVVLCGYTPIPTDRFGRIRSDIHKVALGAEQSVPWRHFETTEEAIADLRNRGVQIVAVEQHNDSVDFKQKKISGPTAFIFGNETEGLPESILKMADTIIEIPMQGTKESLNVSVSVGIVLFK